MARSLLTVDKDRCTKCNYCVMDCPRTIITPGEGGFPVIAPEREPLCIGCGHCVAVCPHMALDVASAPLAESVAIETDLNVSNEQVIQFLRSRRSIRYFQHREVETELLYELIEVASYAPTASNAQLVHWTVLSGREKLAELSRLTVEWMKSLREEQSETSFSQYVGPVIKAWEEGRDSVLHNASTLVVASAPRSQGNGLIDCTIALSYLELAALPLGLGTCWAGLLQAALLNSTEAYAALGLPEEHTWHYPMMIGYPTLKYHRLPKRREPIIAWK